MKVMGQKFSDEIAASGLAGLPFFRTGDGMTECYDETGRLVRLWRDDAGDVREERMTYPGKSAKVTEAQIAAYKSCLASHNESALGPDVNGFESWLCSLPYAMKTKIRQLYPHLILYVHERNWLEVQADLSDARTNATLALSQQKYNELRMAAITTYRLPVTMPTWI